MNRTLSAVMTCVALSIGAGGCAIQHTGDTIAPSPASSSSTWFVGTWKSSVVSAPAGSTCGNFEWRVTNQADGIISGIFFAQCGGSLAVSGSAWGQPNGATIPITATAGGTGPGIAACDVSFASTAVADGDTIRVPYFGTTCLGPISGTEVLRRQ